MCLCLAYKVNDKYPIYLATPEIFQNYLVFGEHFVVGGPRSNPHVNTHCISRFIFRWWEKFYFERSTPLESDLLSEQNSETQKLGNSETEKQGEQSPSLLLVLVSQFLCRVWGLSFDQAVWGLALVWCGSISSPVTLGGRRFRSQVRAVAKACEWAQAAAWTQAPSNRFYD